MAETSARKLAEIVDATGVIKNFESTGIDDNATSTKLTIDSSGNATFVGTGDVDVSAGTFTTSSINGGQLAGMRNLIINGDMRIDQRNNGAAVSTNGSFPIDRFLFQNTVSGATATGQQSSTAPTVSDGCNDGFINSIVYTTSTGVSASSSEASNFQHRIEGVNMAHLKWGTADAKDVTLSFWTKSSKSGTFSGSFRNSGNNRSFVFTYTISAVNTWEKQVINITGDTTGTWLTNNGVGTRITFDLGSGTFFEGATGWSGGNYTRTSGSQSIIATSGANFYLTGVQLEIGSAATPFEHRPYGTELALCERYLQYIGIGGSYINAFDYTQARYTVPTRQRMRASSTPSIDTNIVVGNVGTPTLTMNADNTYVHLHVTSSGTATQYTDANYKIKIESEL